MTNQRDKDRDTCTERDSGIAPLRYGNVTITLCTVAGEGRNTPPWVASLAFSNFDFLALPRVLA